MIECNRDLIAVKVDVWKHVCRDVLSVCKLTRLNKLISLGGFFPQFSRRRNTSSFPSHTLAFSDSLTSPSLLTQTHQPVKCVCVTEQVPVSWLLLPFPCCNTIPRAHVCWVYFSMPLYVVSVCCVNRCVISYVCVVQEQTHNARDDRHTGLSEAFVPASQFEPRLFLPRQIWVRAPVHQSTAWTAAIGGKRWRCGCQFNPWVFPNHKGATKHL